MRVPFISRIIFLFSIPVFFTACGQSSENAKKVTVQKKGNKQENWSKTIPGSFSEQKTIHFDSISLDDFLKEYPKFNTYAEDMRKFYRGRQFAYAWFDNTGMIEQAGNLRNRVDHITDEGLNTDIPYHQQFDTLMSSYDEQQEKATTGKQDIKAELMLTAAYFSFAYIAWQGQDAAVSKSMDWFLPRKKIAYDEVLDSLLKMPATAMKQNEPVYRQYELLRSFLKKYRELDKENNWPAIKADKKSYKQGDESPAIGDIRKRLYLLGDLSGDTTGNIYDAGMVDAVKGFQRRIGLEEDGVIGAAMITELNVTPKERITQILVNMERSRWVPVQQDGDYLVVNIPEYRLHVYENDSLAWNCNVVVGQTMSKTVIFNGDVKYVVFSPYWNVPPSIVRKDVVPGMRRRKNYLASHNMEITGNSGGLPSVRQKPGPNNSLGLVKFLFPNSYNIYLHDSPAKSLFDEPSRAFSHGCIRVAEPEKLANFLLRNDSAWTPEKINAAMHLGKEKYVTLKDPVPVYIAYFTAFVDSHGKINFRKDIYKRDQKLAETLLVKVKS